jgi:hypothetical protein
MSMALAEWLGAGIAYDLFDTELPGEYGWRLRSGVNGSGRRLR